VDDGRRRAQWFITLSTLGVHLAFATRYDFFRDELYFIICGRHPAFGYVDQPPLVPLLAAASQAFGEHLLLLRLPAALSAAATAFITVELAVLLGARLYGATLAGCAAAFAPMVLGLTATLGTSTFEPLLWTLLAFLVTRALVEQQPRWFLLAGVVVGVDLELKYALPVYLLPLLLALVATGHGRALWRWEVAAGAAVAIALAAPSALWQLNHGLPFLEMIHNQRAEGKNVLLGPLAFVGQQLQVMNVLFAPVWLMGVVGPWRLAPLKVARPLSLAFALSFGGLLLLQAKDYYVAPLYGAMFAVGAVALEEVLQVRWLRALHLGAALALSAIVAPIALPILPPGALPPYLQAFHLQPKAAETLAQGALPQTFTDMLGWREMTATVTDAVNQLTPEERARTVILAHNYGEAAAFQFYGRGLPPVVAGHNQYFLWGPGDGPADLVLDFNRSEDQLRAACSQVRKLAHFWSAWSMPFENDSAVTLCIGPSPSLRERWPSVKFYF
jgi:4-amino-4-deoxy-L-arabinose transferase-like glycosyltransferase